MGKESRGKRDGSGPYKGSFVRRSGQDKGRDRQAGKPCPKKSK